MSVLPIIMAKRPVPGNVKTRMCPPFSPEQASDLHRAMLGCILARCETWFGQPGILAINTPDTSWVEYELDAAKHWQILQQGQGDLGQRMERVWQQAGSSPVMFLGSDSPDIPDAFANNIQELFLQSQPNPCDAAVGPTDDGGYWTLVCRDRAKASVLLHGIDWGSPRVYDQTHSRAKQHGLALTPLPAWHDVDTAKDCSELYHRLGDTEDQDLQHLRLSLESLGCHRLP